MSSEIAVRARGLSKCYRIFARPEDRFKQMLWRRRRKFFREFWAVRDVDLEVRRGETLGVVGRNGSGKSTLLKMVFGTLEPNAGELDVDGRVAGLLELGTGFNPEFTGRENVTLSTSILGLDPRDFESRFEQIVTFAGIGDFIDQPVKSYSSGMYARLAFAVAVHVDADVLVVDEVLAVGDEAFQRKCYARIEQFKARGGAILFVSHATSAILELCDRVLLLEAGERLLTASPRAVTTRYQRLLYAPPKQAETVRAAILAEASRIELEEADGRIAAASPGDPVEAPAPAPEPKDEAYWDPTLRPATTVTYDPQGARIRDPVIVTPSGERVNCLMSNRRYRLCYTVEFEKDCFDLRFHTLFKSVSGLELGGGTFPPSGVPGGEAQAGQRFELQFDFQCRLNAGVYFLNCGVTGNDGRQLHRIVDALAIRVLPAPLDAGFGYVNFSYATTVLSEGEGG